MKKKESGHSVCPYCGKVKPLHMFHSNKGRKGGVQGYCKECISKYMAERASNGPERREASKDQLQVCTMCGEEDKMGTYPSDNNKVSGWSIYCHKCSAIIKAKKDFIKQCLIEG